jgi:ribosome biogenesis protein Nip4
MDPLREFVNRFDANFKIDDRFLQKKENRFFLLNKELEKFVHQNFYYAGAYLGKNKNGRFFPSFQLLALIAEKNANKTVVDRRAAWLFICGRDIFGQGIIKTIGSTNKGSYTLILNEHEECLGFGRIQSDLDGERKGVVIKNILDLGDFLRRETRRQ